MKKHWMVSLKVTEISNFISYQHLWTFYLNRNTKFKLCISFCVSYWLYTCIDIKLSWYNKMLLHLDGVYKSSSIWWLECCYSIMQLEMIPAFYMTFLNASLMHMYHSPMLYYLSYYRDKFLKNPKSGSFLFFLKLVCASLCFFCVYIDIQKSYALSPIVIPSTVQKM